ncbi:hypothetical protein PIB30_037560 [Stylosanthes scabra]|uniref:Uncharacterized protein n=1 Tax=Stylosanthes scabra TaxID=79078 RepID=A0ABU6TFL2_9FABA|nr:hypothetical protein [Stylosanthes scabra]
MLTGKDSKEVSLIPNQNFGINKRISGDCEFLDKEEEGFQYRVVKLLLERWDKMSSIGEMVVEMTQFGVGSSRLVLGCSMARRKSRASIELGVQDFVSIESTHLWGESIRFCTEAKTPQLKSIPEFLEPTLTLIDSPSSDSILKRMSMVFQRFQRLNDGDRGGYISCMFNTLVLRTKNREPRHLEGPERLTTRLTAIADHRE